MAVFFQTGIDAARCCIWLFDSGAVSECDRDVRHCDLLDTALIGKDLCCH